MSIQDLRNVAFVGHGNSGKTATVEGLLYTAKAISRWGRSDDKTSILDYLDDEKDKAYSINLKIGRLKHNKVDINVIDTPGKPDFLGEAVSALYACDTAVITIAANAGIQVNTRNAWKISEKANVAKAILITKTDAENIRVEDVIKQIQNTFGDKCIPITYPIGESVDMVDVIDVINLPENAPDAAVSYRETLVERSVEADDEIMEKFLEEMEIDEATFNKVLKKAITMGVVVPILFVGMTKEKGYDILLDKIVELFPSPADNLAKFSIYPLEPMKEYIKANELDIFSTVITEKTDIQKPEPETIESADGDFLAQVFKSTIDPQTGIRNSFIRVVRGEMTSDGAIYNCSTEKIEKVTGFLHISGKDTKRIDKAVAGDIVVISKMDSLHTCTTITGTNHKMLEGFPFPLPTASFAVHPKTQKDVDKVGEAISRIRAEDPTFVDRIDPVTKERVIVGLTDLHLNIMLDRMKKRSKVEVETSLPIIPYKETITGKAADSYRHKKQSGGAGEFGEVHIEISPSERGAGFEFENAIFGGSIDRVFIPSVEKGLKDQMAKGVIVGFPVVDVHARLYDGKTHPVDSKDRAFQVAARECFKKIFPHAKPKLLEPYMEMEVHIPTEKVGDILADISGARRGRVNDQITDGDFATIMAVAPLSEIQTYSQSLQSMTGGEGTFTMKFSNYEIVPENITQQIIAKYAKKVEEK